MNFNKAAITTVGGWDFTHIDAETEGQRGHRLVREELKSRAIILPAQFIFSLPRPFSSIRGTLNDQDRGWQ